MTKRTAPSSSSNPSPSFFDAWRKVLGRYLGLGGILAALIFLFGLLSENFLTWNTFGILANRIPYLTVMAVGMTYVLIIAGIDLSVGSVLALCGTVLGLAMVDGHLPFWLAAPLSLAVGLVCGLINGVISVGWSIPSFIVTLGMLEITRGAAYFATDFKTKYIGNAVEAIGLPIAGWVISPAFLISLVVVILGQFVLARTVFGRYLIAIGTNEEAVRLSGINPRPYKIVVFALMGILTGLGAVFYCSRFASADPNAGVGLELSTIAAVVIGGTSLMGGRGSVMQSFLGVLIITTLEAGLFQVGVEESTKRMITGAVIVAAVVTDTYRNRWAGNPLRKLWRQMRPLS